MTEGRGPMVIIAAFQSEFDAKKASKGWGVMGVGDGKVESLRVYNSFSDYVDDAHKELKERALAKLSFEERRVLGL
jgi:hypothetical protein